MITDIFLIILIVVLILYIAYLHKLHYDEIKGLYSKLGMQLDTNSNNNKDKDNKPGTVKNHIKRKMLEQQKQQGGE